MILGEVGNFSAYGFAPASLVAPLGTTTVIGKNFFLSSMLHAGCFDRIYITYVNNWIFLLKITANAIIAVIFLGEKIRMQDLFGKVICKIDINFKRGSQLRSAHRFCS